MSSHKGIGQYDLEYMSSPCAWGKKPAKFVEILPRYIQSGTVLDLGAGEGKNSMFLAKQGFHVTSVEISLYAVRNFINWMLEEKLEIDLEIVKADAMKFSTDKKYDVVIAYGLLHSLPSRENIDLLVEKMKTLTKEGGLNIICTFTDVLPVPEAQEYLEPILLKPFELRDDLYGDWQILEYENGEISETHPSNNIEHQHSLCRLIARKPK
jgi:tellurite methyltransferase